MLDDISIIKNITQQYNIRNDLTLLLAIFYFLSFRYKSSICIEKLTLDVSCNFILDYSGLTVAIHHKC